MSLTDTPIFRHDNLDQPDPILLANLPEEISAKLTAMTDFEAWASTERASKTAGAGIAHDDRARAQSDLGRIEARSTIDANTGEREIASFRDRGKRADKRAAEADAAAERATQVHTNAQKTTTTVTRFANSRRTYKPLAGGERDPLTAVKEPGGKVSGFDLRIVPVKLPAGDSREIVANQRAQIARLNGEKAGVEQAPLPKDMVLRQARLQIEKAASRGEISVSLGDGGHHGVAVLLPKVAIPGVTTSLPSASRALVVDTEALACRYWRDEILAAVEASVDTQYAGVETVLEPHQQARRLKELTAKILEAERIECAAIWKLIEAGDRSVFFRPDCDPRAILGVE